MEDWKCRDQSIDSFSKDRSYFIILGGSHVFDILWDEAFWNVGCLDILLYKFLFQSASGPCCKQEIPELLHCSGG